jgi:hypothetical protein
VDQITQTHRDQQPCSVLAGDFTDFDELAEKVTGWGLDWIQLDKGPLRARIRQLAGPSIMLSRFRFSRKFHQRGQSPPGVRTFGLNGRGSPVPEWQRGASRENAIIVFPLGDEFDAVSQAGFYGDTMSISEERIRQVARYLGAPDPLRLLSRGLNLVDTAPELIGSIRARLDAMHSDAEGPPGVIVILRLARHPKPSSWRPWFRGCRPDVVRSPRLRAQCSAVARCKGRSSSSTRTLTTHRRSR